MAPVRLNFKLILFLSLTFIVFLVLIFASIPTEPPHFKLEGRPHGDELVVRTLPAQTSNHTKALPECNSDLTPNLSLDDLLKQVSDSKKSVLWNYVIKQLQSTWHFWTDAVNVQMLQKQKRKKIIVVPGLLKATDFWKNASVLSGGPQGDLYQWANLIAALHVLGHRVVLDEDINEVNRNLLYYRYKGNTDNSSSGEQCFWLDVDLVFTDIISMKVFLPDARAKYRCHFRVLDAYGTHAEYNSKKLSEKLEKYSYYGQLELQLKQFYTFYPHTQDNTFLGFALPPAMNINMTKKEDILLLYGKDPAYFTDHVELISRLTKVVEVHATVSNASTLPSSVINHGVVSSSEYRRLLARAKFLLGLGLPLESTGVMEALSLGCVFINPKFNKESQKLLQTLGKPTSRQLSSQVPYLEQHVGPPYAWTVDLSRWDRVERALQVVPPPHPLTPHEFSVAGFLQRVNTLIQHQDPCRSDWPPKVLLRPMFANWNASCEQGCAELGLICEPRFFEDINSRTAMMDEGEMRCNIMYVDDPAAPYFMKKNKHFCAVLSDPNLYSCSARKPEVMRLCPCRNRNINGEFIY